MDKKVIKVLSMSGNPNDGTAWYRSTLPFARLQQARDDFQFIEYGWDQVQWKDLIHFDVLFIQRPNKVDFLALANKAITLGLLVWIDYDDLLTEVPPHSIAYRSYKPKTVEEIKQLLMGLNPGYTIVSVSTEALAVKVLELNPNLFVIVIKNALDPKLFFPLKYLQKPQEAKFKFGWRGSETHRMDLEIYRTDLLVSMMRGDTWEFIGHEPNFIHQHWHLFSKNVTMSQPHGLLEYFVYINNGGPRNQWKFWVTMLEDNAFNRCKSNIMALEAAIAGALPIVPDWQEWNALDGAIIYDTQEPGSLSKAIAYANQMSDEEYFERQIRLHTHITERYNLVDWNNIRFNILNSLISNFKT